MAITIQTDTTLDVVCKQSELVAEALGADSAYIRLKETLSELLDKGDISKDSQAKIIAETMAGMANSITQGAMQTALQWEAQEKDLALKKEELGYRLDILAQEKLLAEERVADSLASRQLKQAQLLRDFGQPTTNGDGDVTSLMNTGRLYAEQQNTEQDTKNKIKQEIQIEAQTEQVYANTHKLVADTYVNHGTFTWTSLSDTGLTGVTKANTGYVTLSDMNKQVAKEQARGYVYNAWANASTAGASMLGTVISAENPSISGTTITELVNLWKTPTTNLANETAPNITI